MHVSNFNIEEVPLMTFDAFQVKFKYSATWSDRYAVHPCTIRFSGGGVCPRDREEPSSHLVRIRVRVRVRVGWR